MFGSLTPALSLTNILRPPELAGKKGAYAKSCALSTLCPRGVQQFDEPQNQQPHGCRHLRPKYRNYCRAFRWIHRLISIGVALLIVASEVPSGPAQCCGGRMRCRTSVIILVLALG